MSKPTPQKQGVKVPAFKHSTRNESASAYRERVKVLKKTFGVKVPFSTKKLTTKTRKKIDKLVTKYVGYLNPKNRFKFVKANAKTLRAVKKRGDISKDAVTAKGVFIQAPKTRKKTSIKISPSGEIVSKTGKRSTSYVMYRSADIVRDPLEVIREAKRRKATHVLVNIKGYAGKKRYSVKAFEWYIKNKIVPDIEEKWEDDEDGEENTSAFSKNFGVEFVTFNRSKK